MKPRKLSSGNWTIQIMVKGQRISITDSTKSAVINRAMAIKESPLPTKRQSMTWREAIDLYLDNSENVLSPSTLKQYNSSARNHFQDIMDLNLDDEINWQIEINKDAGKCAPKTVQNNWTMISSVMTFYKLPKPDVRLPQIPEKEMPFLDMEEIKILMDKVENTDIESVVLLALNGLRRSELLALKKSDVDFKNHNIHVHGAIVASRHGFVKKETNKNVSSSRIVPILIPRLEEVLKNTDDPLVKYAPESIARKIRMDCLTSGLPDHIGCHALRHSFCSLCYTNGITEGQCMKWGGWSDPGTMRKVYTHFSEREQSKAAEAIRSLF